MIFYEVVAIARNKLCVAYGCKRSLAGLSASQMLIARPNDQQKKIQPAVRN